MLSYMLHNITRVFSSCTYITSYLLGNIPIRPDPFARLGERGKIIRVQGSQGVGKIGLCPNNRPISSCGPSRSFRRRYTPLDGQAAFGICGGFPEG